MSVANHPEFTFFSRFVADIQAGRNERTGTRDS